MSRSSPVEERHGSFDPGGKSKLRKSPSPIELDLDRLVVANALYKNQVANADGRINSVEVYNPTDVKPTSDQRHDNETRHKSPLEGDNYSREATLSGSPAKIPFDRATIVSADSGFGSVASQPARMESFSTVPTSEHTIDYDSGIIDGMPSLSLEDSRSVTNPKPSTASIMSADPGYLSLSSADFSSYGSLYSRGDVVVPLRQKSPSHLPRPNSENPISTSKLSTQSSRSESWHEDSPRKKLRDFAEKMNYTESEFEQCMLVMGEEAGEADCDKLLKHLVRLRDQTSQLLTVPTTATKQQKRQSSKRPSSSHGRPEGDSKGLRRVVIDGSNIAMEHGHHQIYSCRGIDIVVNYFQKRGHEFITVFVPAHKLRTEQLATKDQHILNELAHRGVVVKTPSRTSRKGHIASYEDRFILKLASLEDAIVVSNDQFRDLKNESTAFRETIEKRILPFVFANDQFIPAEDPLGKRGPTLEQFLRVDPYNANQGTCPYGRKCTYGTKCRFGRHPEKDESYDSALGESFKTSSLKSGLYVSASSTDGPPSRGSQHSDSWTNRQPLLDQQNLSAVPGSRYFSSPSTYPSYMLNSGAVTHGVASPLAGYYLPRDGAAQYQRSPRGYAEYPLMGVTQLPPASRACLHIANDQSYRSIPLDDVHYRSRQPTQPPTPAAPDVTSQVVAAQQVGAVPQVVRLTQTSSLDSTSLTSDTSISTSDISQPCSSTPQPLTEHISTATTPYSTYLAPERRKTSQHRQHRQQLHHRYDAPILKSDPRYKMFFHLSHLFNEKVVRRVMNQCPNETDPQKITAAVLEMQSKTNKIDC